MGNGVALDLLAKIETSKDVTFYREKAWGEVGASDTFGTNREWVKVDGNTLKTVLGAQTEISWVQVGLTAFVPKDSPGGKVDYVYTGGRLKTLWSLQPRDSDPSSPTFLSPSYDASSPPIEMTIGVSVDGEGHSLNLELETTTYKKGDDKPPPDPILIVDIPAPEPNPIGMDVLVANGIPTMPALGPIDILVSIAHRAPAVFDRQGPVMDEFVHFLRRRSMPGRR